MADIKLHPDIEHYLQKTIRNLTFEFKLNHTILYDVIAEYQFEEKIFTDDYYRLSDNDNIADRVKRIMRERVMCNPEERKPTNPNPYNKPKIYDDVMQEAQRDLYNNTIVLLGFSKITAWYTDEFWEMV